MDIYKDKVFEKYNHHGDEVYVNVELKGKHRDYCLCHDCEYLNTVERSENCPIANAIYENCVKYSVVTPVFECPDFEEKRN